MIKNENLLAFNDYQISLINSIENNKILKFIKTKSGDFTIKVIDNDKELFLHSIYNPQNEAARFVNRYEDYSKKIWIIFGFGCGYHVKKLLKKLNKNQRVKIVIVNPDVFKKVLSNFDLSEILNDSRVDIILELNINTMVKKLKNILNNNLKKEIEIIPHKTSLKICSQEFSPIQDFFDEISVRKQNVHKHKNKIHKNIIENISHIPQSVGVNKFRHLFSDKPIFIVSAGPSLDKNIHYLKKIGDKGIIISVDTAIPSLQEVGIKPDFITAIDPNQALYDKIFKNYPDLKIPLIYIASVYPDVLDSYKGPKIVAFTSGDRINNILESYFNKGRLESGGSVASTALDFAYKMGGNPLVLVGQDLAFTEDGVTHAVDTFYNKKKNMSVLKKVPGINKKEVKTSLSYFTYLRWFERYIQEKASVEFIDATEGGAKIKGTHIYKLKKVIKKFSFNKIYKKKYINKIINSNYRQNKQLTATEISKISTEISKNI